MACNLIVRIGRFQTFNDTRLPAFRNLYNHTVNLTTMRVTYKGRVQHLKGESTEDETYLKYQRLELLIAQEWWLVMTLRIGSDSTEDGLYVLHSHPEHG